MLSEVCVLNVGLGGMIIVVRSVNSPADVPACGMGVYIVGMALLSGKIFLGMSLPSSFMLIS